MQRSTLSASARHEVGTRACRRLRRQGLTPAVVYGEGQPPVALQLDTLTTNRTLRGRRTPLIDLDIDGGEPVLAVVREIQRDPVSQELLSLDFLRVSPEKAITVRVPVEITGEPVGVADGGVLAQFLHEVELQCLPLTLPERLVVDVSHLGVNDAASLGDVELPEGVSLITSADTVIAIVSPPTVIETAAEEEAAEEGAEEAEGEGPAEAAEAADESGEEQSDSE